MFCILMYWDRCHSLKDKACSSWQQSEQSERQALPLATLEDAFNSLKKRQGIRNFKNKIGEIGQLYWLLWMSLWNSDTHTFLSVAVKVVSLAFELEPGLGQHLRGHHVPDHEPVSSPDLHVTSLCSKELLTCPTTPCDCEHEATEGLQHAIPVPCSW